MSDPEVATKAPEIDTAEDNVPAAEALAQASPGLGDHCTTDRPSPAGAAPSGEITKIGDVEVYVSKPNDYPHAPSKLLLFLTGGTGLHSTNNQLQADKFAAEGFLVVMPDMFAGDPAPNSTTAVEDDTPTIIEQIKLGAVAAVKSFQIDMWLARHTPEKVMPILLKVIEAAKSEFADAVAAGAGIYGIGYCFGAKYIIILGSEKPEIAASAWGQKASDEEAGLTKNGPYIKTGAIAHGTMITPDDFDGLRVPILLVCVENDQLFPEEVLNHGLKYLKDNGIEHETQIYPRVPHGFAVVGEYADPKIKQAQEKAFDQLLGFLRAH